MLHFIGFLVTLLMRAPINRAPVSTSRFEFQGVTSDLLYFHTAVLNERLLTAFAPLLPHTTAHYLQNISCPMPIHRLLRIVTPKLSDFVGKLPRLAARFQRLSPHYSLTWTQVSTWQAHAHGKRPTRRPNCGPHYEHHTIQDLRCICRNHPVRGRGLPYAASLPHTTGSGGRTRTYIISSQSAAFLH